MTTLLLLACLCISSVSGIMNGQDTTIQNHPHMVAIFDRGTYSCGGSIIGDFWVLTAAHCVQGSNALHETWIQTNNGNILQSVTTYTIDKITPHPAFNQGQLNMSVDIAVLRVTANITDATHQRIELATASDGDFADANCNIIGWGKDEDGVLPQQLQETNGEILSNSGNSGCKNWWGNKYNHGVHICIDNQNTGICDGDAGSPMKCGNKLAGVASWGISGCETIYPGVYARVGNFYDWITSAMNDI